MDGAQHHPDAAQLHEDIDAEAANTLRGDREIELFAGLEFSRLAIVHDRTRELHRVRGGERHTGDRCELAVDLEGRRKIRGQKKV